MQFTAPDAIALVALAIAMAKILTGPIGDAFDKIRPYGFVILYGLLLTGVLWTLVDPIQAVLLRWLL